MKKFIFAGFTAVVLSCAIGFATANAEGKKVKTESCTCKKCACDDCKCSSCTEKNCANGCGQEGVCGKAGKGCCK